MIGKTMSPKKQKVLQANDGIIKADHINQAQRGMMDHGPTEMLKQLGIIEPELAGFIAVVANDIAAHVLMDSAMTRPAAQKLRQQIVALAINVYSTYSRAIHETYQDVASGTPIAALAAEMRTDAPPSTPTPPAKEGGAHGK